MSLWYCRDLMEEKKEKAEAAAAAVAAAALARAGELKQAYDMLSL